MVLLAEVVLGRDDNMYTQFSVKMMSLCANIEKPRC